MARLLSTADRSTSQYLDEGLVVEPHCELDLKRYDIHIQTRIQDFPVSLTDV